MFRDIPELDHHMQVIHLTASTSPSPIKRPYQCQICEKSFPFTDAFEAHMKSEHARSVSFSSHSVNGGIPQVDGLDDTFLDSSVMTIPASRTPSVSEMVATYSLNKKKHQKETIWRELMRKDTKKEDDFGLLTPVPETRTNLCAFSITFLRIG